MQTSILLTTSSFARICTAISNRCYLPSVSQKFSTHSANSNSSSSSKQRNRKVPAPSSASPVRASQFSLTRSSTSPSTATSTSFSITPAYLQSHCSYQSAIMSSATARALTAELLNTPLPSTPSHPTLLHYGIAVLTSNDTPVKARLTVEAYKFYHQCKVYYLLD
jgi:hypothetical protein